MTALQFVLQHPLLKPLGWTLVHFLWQGAAAAVLLAGLFLLMRRASANARYLAACAIFFVLAACPVATFVLLRSAGSSPGSSVSSLAGAASWRFAGAPAPADLSAEAAAAGGSSVMPLSIDPSGAGTTIEMLLPWLVV